MTIQQNKDTANRIFELLRQDDIEGVAALVTEDFFTHCDGSRPDDLKGPESVRQRLEGNREKSPGASFVIHDLFGEGDRLAVRMAWSAPAGGDDPEAKTGGTNVEVWRFEDGKLAECWSAGFTA